MASFEQLGAVPSGLTVDELAGTVSKISKELNWLLRNLDDLNISSVTTDKIIAGTAKISTALIEDLIVGGNVTMGENATISWGQVTDADTYSLSAWKASGYATYIDANGIYTGELTANQINAIQGITLGEGASINWNYVTKPSYTAGDVGALPDTTQIPTLPSYIKSTYIDSTTVQSPTIIGGSITGGVVQTADASLKRIVIDTAGITSYDGSYKNGFYTKAGTFLEGAMGINHNGVSAMSMHWDGQGRGYLESAGDLYIYNGSSIYKTYFGGSVDFSDATVTGLNFAATSHTHSEYADADHTHAYATTLWVTNTFARKDHIHSGYYLTIDSFNTKMAEHIAEYH